MAETHKVYLIFCCTGCSCCSHENHYRGPYTSEGEANRRIHFFKTGDWHPLCSQYSKRGNYKIREIEVEELPDGRLILNNEFVHDPKRDGEIKFVKVNDIGNVDDNNCERNGFTSIFDSSY